MATSPLLASLPSLLALGVLAACSSPAEAPQPAGGGVTTAGELETPDARRASPCRPTSVEFHTGYAPLFQCPADGPECTADYLTLPDRYAEHGKPLPLGRLAKQIRALRAQEVPIDQGDWTPSAVRKAIIERTNLGWMLEGMEERPLRAIKRAESWEETYRRRDLVLEDPIVGQIDAILLLPPGPGPHPAVLGVHGHFEDPESFVENLRGWRFPERGYALLVPRQRVVGGASWEDRVTRRLLRRGFSLMAVRVYEHLLALRVLRALDDVHPGRVAIVGHSGGAVAAALTIRVAPGVRAFVSDATGLYWGESTSPDESPPIINDETVPGLFPLHRAIADFEAAPMPVLQLPYGLDDQSALFGFLDEHIGQQLLDPGPVVDCAPRHAAIPDPPSPAQPQPPGSPTARP